MNSASSSLPYLSLDCCFVSLVMSTINCNDDDDNSTDVNNNNNDEKESLDNGKCDGIMFEIGIGLF